MKTPGIKTPAGGLFPAGFLRSEGGHDPAVCFFLYCIVKLNKCFSHCGRQWNQSTSFHVPYIYR